MPHWEYVATGKTTKHKTVRKIFLFSFCFLSFFFMVFVLRGGVVFQVRHYAGSSRQPFNRIDAHGEGRGGGWLKCCDGVTLQSYGQCDSWNDALAIELPELRHPCQHVGDG